MVDAPGDYDQVNVEVLDVLIKATSDNDDSQGWVSIGNLPPEGKIVDLLKLTGGVNALLADDLVPSGKLGQIRLLLGDDNTVVLAGGDPTKPIPLNTPSAQQSGLKLKVNQTLLAGKTYEFLLDFDVEHSVVVQAGGSGIYNLHPVIRVSTKENTGGIKGTVGPSEALPVLASVPVEGGGTISALTDASGVFQLNGVPAGTYEVKLIPAEGSGYKEGNVPGVVVVNGTITEIKDGVVLVK
jgi:hypothetical protein